MGLALRASVAAQTHSEAAVVCARGHPLQDWSNALMPSGCPVPYHLANLSSPITPGLQQPHAQLTSPTVRPQCGLLPGDSAPAVPVSQRESAALGFY